MKNMSVGKKLVIGFLAVIVVSLCGSLFAITGLITIADDVQMLVDNANQLTRMQSLRFGVYHILLRAEQLQNPSTGAEEYEQIVKVTMNDIRAEALQALTDYETLFNSDAYIKQAIETKYLKAVHAAIEGFDEMVVKIRDYAIAVQGRPDSPTLNAGKFYELGMDKGRDAIIEAVETLKDLLDDENTSAAISATGSISAGIATSIAAGIVVCILGLAIGITLSNSISNVIQSISKTILTNAEYVTSSSKELAAGSQALAAGSSEQAASVEEISASLEEISSMVKRNADNATQANKLTKTAGQAVDATSKSMQQSLAASEAIAQASNETSKIIKTIDEIAFQTNLLSLNAAVEAARAGEAGAGFAVVADEVRGLSMRSAEASKRTAELIEQTILKVREGIGIFNETGKSIDAVVSQTHKIQQLVEEIAAASDEQSKGIEQINRGVSEMEKVIQQNAANSEESAASTEELHGQATEMTDCAHKLEEYVFGSRAED